MDELTIGETHFMRDPDQMEFVRREVFPALTAPGSGGGRVWSAGCATGEEAYSLAILLEEEGLGDGAVVLGTDLSAVSLEKARAGSYSDYSLRGVGSRFLQDYFHHVQGRRILIDRIRSKVRFERLNFVGPEDYAAAGAFAMDLILCRNVLIYFGREKVGRIAARLFDCLAEGGVLLTAGADPHPQRVRALRSRGDARGPRVPASPRRAGGGGAAEARPGGAVPPPWSPDHVRRARTDEEPAPTVGPLASRARARPRSVRRA